MSDADDLINQSLPSVPTLGLLKEPGDISIFVPVVQKENCSLARAYQQLIELHPHPKIIVLDPHGDAG